MQPIAKAITMIQPRQARGELEVSKKMLLMLMMYKLLCAKVNQKGANQGVTIRKSR